MAACVDRGWKAVQQVGPATQWYIKAAAFALGCIKGLRKHHRWYASKSGI